MRTIELIRSDAARYAARPNLLKLYFLMRGFNLSVWLRLGKEARSWPRIAWLLKMIVLYRLRQVQRLSGTDIGVDTEIGPGLYIPHAIGIVVNGRARIGANCYLSHNVTIGKKHGGRRVGVPIIGDDVFIAPGAVVIGGIQVGDSAVVGPNSVVVRDVGAGTTVSGGVAVTLVETSGSRETGDHA